MKLWVLDLDGVVYRGDTAIPGVSLFISKVKEKGEEVVFLTNNSAYTRAYYRNKLQKMGISTEERDIYTSAELLADYLTMFPHIRRVLAIGEEGLHFSLRRKGFFVTSQSFLVDAVAVGLDRRFNYQKLSLAQKAILTGAKFVTTNRDVTLPYEDGLLPGSGAILKAIEECTGKEAEVVGKPNPFSLQLIMKERGTKREDVVVVGDRVETDILLGKKAGVKTILVLTGVTRKEDIRNISPENFPDQVIDKLTDLLSRWPE
ncbi:HAD-IIA family hydrolase [Candidatus Calescamantes bacterium]|nr:HAD-IIA family hydrolase [Candidatus Calescamantes bacterium]